MSTSERPDPFGAFNFLVRFDSGAIVAAFSEVGGLTSETDVVDYRTGDSPNPAPDRLVGLHKPGPINCKRGVTSSVLWEWRQTVIDGEPRRESGAVELLNEARDPVMRWEFTGAWPSKWEGPALNAGTSAAAIETLTIVCETLSMVPV